MLVSKLAKMRADRGLTVPLDRLMDALAPSAAGPKRLARAPDPLTHDALLRSAMETRDPTALGILGDFLEEQGLPGAQIARAAMHAGVGHGSLDTAESLVPYSSGGHHWIQENGGNSALTWKPDAVEVLPMHTRYRDAGRPAQAGLFVSHSGTRKPGDLADTLHYHIPVHSLAELSHLTSDLPPAQRAEIHRQLEPHLPPEAPAKLARVLTYVGGPPVPGGKRAIGVWDGGAEASSLASVDSVEDANALAVFNKQKSAISFVPGPGADALHVFHVKGGPQEAKKVLRSHGVSYATLIPSSAGTTVHVVDQGNQFSGVLPGKSVPGTAVYKNL